MDDEIQPGAPAAPAGMPVGAIHRIGGGKIANLRLKPREATLDRPGISVIRAATPQDAARELRDAFPRASGLREQAKIIGTASEAAIRGAGFEVIPMPSRSLPNHHRIVHPAGVAGFDDANLAGLAAVFSDTTGD